MTFDWKNYYRIAQHFFVIRNSLNSLEEACSRSIISRAYYSIYHLGLELYIQERPTENIGTGIGSHLEVINYFRNSGNRTRKRIGNRMDKLRDNRNKADYFNNVPGIEKLSDVSLKIAGNVISDLDSL